MSIILVFTFSSCYSFDLWRRRQLSLTSLWTSKLKTEKMVAEGGEILKSVHSVRNIIPFSFFRVLNWIFSQSWIRFRLVQSDEFTTWFVIKIRTNFIPDTKFWRNEGDIYVLLFFFFFFWHRSIRLLLFRYLFRGRKYSRFFFFLCFFFFNRFFVFTKLEFSPEERLNFWLNAPLALTQLRLKACLSRRLNFLRQNLTKLVNKNFFGWRGKDAD